MKVLLHACITAVSAGLVLTIASVAFAQNSPGVPGGILQDEFRLQEHPQLPFAASGVPNKKFQSNKKSAMRRKGDDGDPNGCNLQCPEDQ